MRHRDANKHLGRTSAHRRALRRNLAASLFEHGQITTTREKAKFVRAFAEKLITLARQGTLAARRRTIALLQDRNICREEDGEPVQVDTVIHKLFAEIGPRFQDRPGGYTQIVNLPLRRVGDNGQLVLLRLLEEKKTAAPAAPVRPPRARKASAPVAPAPAAPTSSPDQPAPPQTPQPAADAAGNETT